MNEKEAGTSFMKPILPVHTICKSIEAVANTSTNKNFYGTDRKPRQSSKSLDKQYYSTQKAGVVLVQITSVLWVDISLNV